MRRVVVLLARHLLRHHGAWAVFVRRHAADDGALGHADAKEHVQLA